MKCTENECVPDCGKCKKYKKTTTYQLMKRVGKFSDPDNSVGVVTEGGNIVRT